MRLASLVLLKEETVLMQLVRRQVGEPRNEHHYMRVLPGKIFFRPQQGTTKAGSSL